MGRPSTGMDPIPSIASSAAGVAPDARLVSLLARLAAPIRRAWQLYLALFIVELVPALALHALGVLWAASPRGSGAWFSNIVRHDTGTAVFIGLATVPFIETAMVWAIARAARALFRSTDAAIVLAAFLLMLTHLPADAFSLAGIFWSFVVYATVLHWPRLPHPFIAAWGLHVAHNAVLMGIVLSRA